MQLTVPWLFDGFQWIPNISIGWMNSTIAEIQQVEAARVPCKNQIAIPGLINLHCHLELSLLRGKLPKRVDFPDWVASLQSNTRSWSQDQFYASVAEGIEESVRHGTTTIFDVGNSGAAELFRNTDRIRVLPHLELIGLEPSAGLARLRHTMQKNPEAEICAHAPYSCSPELIRNVIEICKQRQKPFTMHFAESQIESELYLSAKGKFRNWVDSFYPQHVFQEGRESCWSLFEELNIPSQSILAHGNLLTSDDIGKIAQSQCTIVHCPQSARWFGHPRLDVESCMQRGLSVALGTDSLASAESLSLWEQMRLMWDSYPQLSCETLLSMATGIPGRALAMFADIGAIKVGASMDLLLLELDNAVDPTSGDWLRSGNFKIIAQFVHGKGDLICQKSF